jgi:sugar diacid utilization regulator
VSGARALQQAAPFHAWQCSEAAGILQYAQATKACGGLCSAHNLGMRVDELLRAAGASGVTLVAGPWDARPVEHVMIVDDLDAIETAPRGCLAILTRHASLRADGYELDLVLRRSGQRELAALARYGQVSTSITAIRLADRSRVALLAISAECDLSELAFELETALRSGADAMLRRILSTLEAVREPTELPLGRLLDAASEALGTELRYAERPGNGVSVPVSLGSRTEGWVCADALDPASQVGCRLVADALARLRLSLRSSREAAAQARAAALADVLRAPTSSLAAAAERARLLDVALDGRHGAIAIERADLDGTIVRVDDYVLRRLRHEAEQLAPDSQILMLDGVALLIRTASGGEEAAGLLPLARRMLERIIGGRRSLALLCGVSGLHDGLEGLRAAAGEARAALGAARAEGQINVALSFDASPAYRVLAEIAASSAARSSLDALLAPLDELGRQRAGTAVRTLSVYLDERGSLVRAAKRLHLHPNAVAYRLKQIRRQLTVDLEDPDQRLALQIACRARLFSEQT